MKNNIGVYKITNKINSKVYVGSTSNLRKRKNDHFSQLKSGTHHNIHLQHAFNKYGEKNFIFEKIEFIDDVTTLLDREEYWIKILKATDKKFGYNARVHVDCNRGFKHTKESRLKISINRAGKGTGRRVLSPETIKLKRQFCIKQNLQQYRTKDIEQKRIVNLRKTLCNKQITDTHKKKISKLNSGEKNGSSKLTVNDVVRILKLAKYGKMKQKELAKDYNVSSKAITNLLSGRSWKHITMPFIEQNGPIIKSKNRGNTNASSKLTNDNILEIYSLYKKHLFTQKQLAEKFNVAECTISRVLHDKLWQCIAAKSTDSSMLIEITDDIKDKTMEDFYL